MNTRYKIEGRIKGMWKDMRDRCTSQRAGWVNQRPSRAKYFGMSYPDFEAFRAWLLVDTPFLAMWEAYVKSEFDSRLNPTIDRIDSRQPGQGKGYVFENMRVLTHSDNSSRILNIGPLAMAA